MVGAGLDDGFVEAFAADDGAESVAVGALGVDAATGATAASGLLADGSAPAAVAAVAAVAESGVLLLEPEYWSAYQPLPFKMKLPVPTRRVSAGFLHFGHVRRKSAVIRCSISKPCLQASQAYS